MFLTANIFQPLIDVFESVLVFFHNHVGISWGFSIVLLTICVRAVLIPLTVKQFGSMQRLQQLQPELKAIQNKYKDDKERQQQEVMRFYRENKVNPLGSCLPMVLQIPVFISLFYMLRKNLRVDICPQTQEAYQAKYAAAHHISVHAAAGQTVQCGPHNGAGFLFVNDLTNKATGITLIVLIVLYIGTQLASSLMMSTATMDKTQRQIMLFMPLIFVLFVINFPAGVIVYWITTNSWTILQQYIVKKRVGHIGPPVVPGEGSSGAGPAGRGGGRGGGGGSGPSGGPNGDVESGGLAGLIRGRLKPAEDREKVAAGPSTRTTAPPPPPRKKKKRSGRRR
jgi:YidC/Oxa1 family membrane protein insertase